MKKLLSILFLVLIGLTMRAQQPYFRHLSEDEGLPSATVYKLVQDKKGYIWIGTEHGLVRFDSEHFAVFDHPALKGSEIMDITEDPWGRIWFHTLNGQLSYCDGISVSVMSGSLVPADRQINFIAWVKDTLYAGCAVGENYRGMVYRFAFDSSRKPIRCDSVIIGQNVKSIFHDDKNTYLLSDKLYRISQRLEFQPILPANYFVGNIKMLTHGTEGSFLMLQENAIALCKQQQCRVVFRRPSLGNINKCFQMGQYVWVLAQNGAIQAKLHKDGKYEIVREYLPGRNISSLILDREGNYWFGTLGEGIFVFPNPDILVYTQKNGGLANDNVQSLLVAKGNGQLMAGHPNGAISLLKDEKVAFTKKISNGGTMYQIAAAGNGDLFVLSGSTLFMLNQQLEAVRSPIVDANLKHIQFGKADDVYVTNHAGVFQLKLNDFSYLHQRKLRLTKFAKKLLGIRSYSLCLDDNASLWIGSVRGLFLYKNGEAIPFLENGRQELYRVNTILKDDKGTVWVGTQNNGLLAIQSDSLQYKLTTENGLVSNNCLSLLQHGEHLYIGTNKGLHQFNRLRGEIRLLDRQGGLPSNEILAIAAIDSQLWVGTPEGLAKLPFSALRLNAVPPSIYITKVSVAAVGRPLQNDYELGYRDNTLEIRFQGLAYRASTQHTYRYRMIGLDSTWRTTMEPIAIFPGLAPSFYVFEVLAVNEDGVPSLEPATVSFNILPPWWATWWFRIGAASTLIGAVLLVQYFRFKAIRANERKEHQLQSRIDKLRMHSLQVQMNPHFIFNALTSIQQYVSRNDEKQALVYLSKFARLMRHIFDKFTESHITLQEELDFLKVYIALEQLRFGDRITVQINVDPALEAMSEEIAIPPLLVQPVVENAFKHGLLHREGDGFLQVDMKKSGHFLLVTVQDNGVGRAQAHQFNSWKRPERPTSGLKALAERLEIIKSQNLQHYQTVTPLQITDLLDTNGKAAGTRVELTIIITAVEKDVK